MNVYLDNNATTQPLDSVTESMAEVLRQYYANPSSAHLPGRKVRATIEQAREVIATLIGARIPDEIIFTSGGTESINQAIFDGLEVQATSSPPTLIISSVEHAAVQEVSEFHAARGIRIEKIGVDSKGHLDLVALRNRLAESPKASMVSIMWANNETGVIFPIAEIANLCRAHGTLLHVDAVQAVGKLPINIQELGCDYLSLSAHKFHGPKGIGALYIRHGAPRQALIRGHQESGARGGTENVPGIVGMAMAAQALHRTMDANTAHMLLLRNKLESGILAAVPDAQVNGDVQTRLCNTSNIYFPGKNSANLVEQLSARGVYVSSGAACTTGGNSSHVLRAMGLGDERANSSLRFSLSKFSTLSDIKYTEETVKTVISTSLNVYSVN